MANYVIITLDTTPPKIRIYAPKYTTKSIYNEIIIESNEELAEYQDIYAIDPKGDKHNLTFQRETDKRLVGVVRFNDMSDGIVAIHARVKDVVGNISNLASATIEIKDSISLLSLDISDSQRDISVRDNVRPNEVSDITYEINANDTSQNIHINSKVSDIEIGDRGE